MDSARELEKNEGTVVELQPGGPVCLYLRSLTQELRNILTTVKISSEMLNSPRANNAAYREVYATLIDEQTGRISRLLDDFGEAVSPFCPDLSENGDLADLNRAAQDAVAELEGLAVRVQTHLLFLPASRKPQIVGNQGKVTQAIRGFLEYLLGALPSGSTLTLTVKTGHNDSGGPELVFAWSSRDPRAESPVVLDWGRINLVAARRIVEQYGGEVLGGTVEEGARGMRVQWPAAPEAAALALFRPQPLGPIVASEDRQAASSP